MNVTPVAGNTPLTYAAREGHFTALKMILDAGAHPDPGNKVINQSITYQLPISVIVFIPSQNEVFVDFQDKT